MQWQRRRHGPCATTYGTHSHGAPFQRHEHLDTQLRHVRWG